jgi:hypothetical protein
MGSFININFIVMANPKENINLGALTEACMRKNFIETECLRENANGGIEMENLWN